MIENKVSQSGLITIDIEKWMPEENEISVIDLKSFLFKELILKEKEFRQAVAEMDITTFEGKIIAIFCSNDAIIPMWAYMLMSAKLSAINHQGIYYGNASEVVEKITLDRIKTLDLPHYDDQRLVIKGCGDKNAGPALYLELTSRLLPIAKSIMYGEPCSTVPIFKKKKI